MAYHGVHMLPTDFDDWRHLVQSAVSMAVSTFGLAEVQQWRFEVWNELWGPCVSTATPPITTATATASERQ